MVLRRGVATLIAAAVALPILLFSFIVLYQTIVAQTEYGVKEVRAAVSRAVKEVEALEAYATASGSTITVRVSNVGYGDAYVSTLFITYTDGSGMTKKFALKLNTTMEPEWPVTDIEVTGGLLTSRGLLVEPGSSATITISLADSVSNVGGSLVTTLGNVFPLKKPPSVTTESIATTFVMFSVPSITDLVTRSDIYIPSSDQLLAPGSPTDPGTGMTSNDYSGIWCLYKELDDVDVEGSLYFTTLYIGFDSAWTQLRTGPPIYVVSVTTTRLWGVKRSFVVGPVDVKQVLKSYPAVKIVLEGYRGTIKYVYYWYSASEGIRSEYRSNSVNPADVVGIKLYGQHLYAARIAPYVSYVKLDGTAKKAYIYVRSSTCGWSRSVSYKPYMLIGDFDNNGYPEILFTTEDGYFDYWSAQGRGSSIRGNDIDVSDVSTFSAYVKLNDYSKVPFTIILRGYPIDSNKYIAVQVAIRYYFHDDAALDEEEIDTNEWIIRVGLYDPDENDIVTWYDLGYQLLTRYEDTYPPAWDYRVETLLIPVPQTGKTYYLALEFRDPYPASSSYNDADMLIGIEYLSIIYMSPQS